MWTFVRSPRMSRESDFQARGCRHQGLVHDRRYQARPSVAWRSLLRPEPSQPGTAARRAGRDRNEPTACHRARSFGASKSPARETHHSPMPRGQAATTPQPPCRRHRRRGWGWGTTERPKPARNELSTTAAPVIWWVGTSSPVRRFNWPHLRCSMPIADRHDRGHRIAAFRIPTGSRYDHEHHDRDPYSCRHPRDRGTPAEEAAYLLSAKVQSAMGMSVAESSRPTWQAAPPRWRRGR